jgi:hypothetical protein
VDFFSRGALNALASGLAITAPVSESHQCYSAAPKIMFKLCFRPRVLVYEAEGDRVMGWISLTEAARRIRNRSANVHSHDDAGAVIAIRAIYAKREMHEIESIFPGSIGIRKLTSENGARWFEHHRIFSIPNRRKLAA